MTFNEIGTFINKIKMLESREPVAENRSEPEPYIHPLVLAMRELQSEGIVETASTGQGGGSAGNGGGQMVGGPTTYEQEYGMFKRKGPRRIIAMTNEVLDSSYPYQQRSDGGIYFKSDNNTLYKVTIKGREYAEISFAAYKNDDWTFYLTGTGDSHKVFGTVVQILKNFAIAHKPKEITFFASSNDDNRIRLYKAMASRIDKALPDYVFSGMDKDRTIFDRTVERV